MPSGLEILAPLLRKNCERSRHGSPRVSPDLVRRFLKSGLGPMLHELVQHGRIIVDSQSASNLAGCALAAIAIHDRTVAALGQSLKILNDLGIRPVLLKGACFAPHYYPKPHWRAMADIDILVNPAVVDEAARALRNAGFRNPSGRRLSDWDSHHHVAPLFHPQLRIWVEVHRGLFRYDSPFSALEIFQTPRVLRICRPVREYDADVFYLPDEFNLSYLACHWYWNLMSWPSLDSARGLIDAAFLLHKVKDPPIKSWVTEDAAGTAVAVLLLALIKGGLVGRTELDLWRCLGPPRSARARNTRFLAALVRWRIVGLKSSDNAFFTEVLGDWFRVLLDSDGQRNILGTVSKTTAVRIRDLIKYKISGNPAE